MSTPEDVLGWLHPALEQMRRDYDADPATPWEERRESFLRELGLSDASQYPVVQELLERLDETPEDERGKILGSDELDRLADELARQHAAGPASEQPGGQQAGYDEHAWQAFLAENGPRWDGTDAAWDQFRQWFAYTADQQGLGTPATALLEYLAAQSAAERIATFGQYGVTIMAPQAAAADGAGYDERAWQAFLAENGPRWDGTDAAWDQFRQWFVYTAGQQSLGAPATALLDYLASQPAAERIATFAQYGVTIMAPQAPQAAQPGVAAQAAQAPAAAEQGGQEAEQPAEGEVSAAETESIMGDALQAHPEIADMPEEERIAAMSEVLNRL